MGWPNKAGKIRDHCSFVIAGIVCRAMELRALGRKGALLSLSLYVFDPNFLAHGQLVTADLPAALMITIALYHFWQFLKLRGKGRALLSATTLGLSQLAKYSCVYLYPIFVVIGAIYRRSRTAAEVVMSGWRNNVICSLRRASIVTGLFAG